MCYFKFYARDSENDAEKVKNEMKYEALGPTSPTFFR